jgi:hypothetical protein
VVIEPDQSFTDPALNLRTAQTRPLKIQPAIKTLPGIALINVEAVLESHAIVGKKTALFAVPRKRILDSCTVFD